MSIKFKKLWDQFTDQYSFLPIHPQYFLKKYNSTAIKLALKHAKGILLDIGCGRMAYKKILVPKVDQYLGLDHPQVSKKYEGKEKPNILADATKIPLPDSYCNTILSLQVLEHLPDPQEALKEIARLLKPQGKLILSTIQSYPTHDEPYDFFRYTRYGLKNLCQKSGLRITKYVSEGNVFVLIFQSFNVYLMLVLKDLIKQKAGKFLAIFLAPLILLTTFLVNLATFPFTFLDKNSKFRIIHTIVAKKSN